MLGIILVIALSILGCTKQTSKEALQAQVARGQILFESHCATCHTGAGAFGPILTRDLLQSYETAHDLGQYVWHEMPYSDPGSLGVYKSYDIVAYLLVLNDLGNLDQPLDIGNDESIYLLDNF
jgi:cytochrome c